MGGDEPGAEFWLVHEKNVYHQFFDSQFHFRVILTPLI